MCFLAIVRICSLIGENVIEHRSWLESADDRLDRAIDAGQPPLTVAARVELAYPKIVIARRAGQTWPRIAQALRIEGEDALEPDNVRIAFGRVERQRSGTGGGASCDNRGVFATFIAERDAPDRLPRPYEPWQKR